MNSNSLFIALCAFSATAHAVDGQTLITHAKAMAGNITPGDAPGYPVTISTAGSYKLGGNLVVPDQKTTGIEIKAQNVTIDLNGFGVYGPNKCTGQPVDNCDFIYGGGSGITSSYRNTWVHDGIVQGMGTHGLALGEEATVDNVNSSHNGVTGIIISSGSVRNSHSMFNYSSGISAYKDAIVSGNRMSWNGDFGLIAYYHVLAKANNAAGNGQYGIFAQSSDVGYSDNVLSNNKSRKVHGGTNLGGNL